MNIILSATNVTFQDFLSYPQIQIEEHRTTFLCGESGCGKSTLLKLFYGTVSPSGGVLTYKGQDIATLDTIALRQEVLLVSQTVFLFDGTIRDNFHQYYAYREIEPLSDQDIKGYLSLCCATFDLSAPCETMSGGERQRVFIAICLSFLPKVLMLDEPTSALDSVTADTFLERIKTFCTAHEITLIVISHDQILADQFGDRTLFLKREVEK
ncbi:MAG: ABC transporter ATP-binding protein [Lachnospiraceae bacterium]